MDGPRHYREAERLIGGQRHHGHGHITDLVPDATTVAAAQVHATLALAAATAEIIEAEPGRVDRWGSVLDGQGEES